MQITNLKVFVSISGQIATQVAQLPSGSKISGVSRLTRPLRGIGRWTLARHDRSDHR